MALRSGLCLGPYEIVERIGSGGMGEVYRAYDSRLDRFAALKVLPAELANNAHFLTRLEREAKVISSLHHPNICVLHDVGEAREGDSDASAPAIHYLVMELCEGPTLALHLAEMPLRMPQILEYGIQIADALAWAHRAGIVHRDLKPSNIILTKEGVKLIDFGLAKDEWDDSSDESTTDLRHVVTAEGEIAGTLRYMAPELLNGARPSPASDIFSLGLILYEMVTGRMAFSGGTRAEIIASILKDRPVPVRQARPEAPRALEILIETCLRKEPEERWESAHDVAEQLRMIRDMEAHPEPERTSRTPGRRLIMTMGLIGLVSISTVAGWLLREPAAPPPVLRLSVPLESMARYVNISPTGDSIVYRAILADTEGDRDEGVARLYLRRLDRSESTELAPGGVNPFFSPDGRWIGHSTGTALVRTPVRGGVTETVFRGLNDPRGATWGFDGYIYFSPSFWQGLWRVPESGGTAEPVTDPDRGAGENNHRWPHALPDGKSLLFTIRPAFAESYDDAKIAVLSLETGRWRVIHEGGHSARYTRGFIVFIRGRSLYAAPVDENTWSLQRTPEEVLNDLGVDAIGGYATFSTTPDGDLVYLPGPRQDPRTSLILVKRDGSQHELGSFELATDRIALSPDRTRIAIQASGANDQIWTYDLERKVATRLTFERDNAVRPTWSADGREIFYKSFAEEGIMSVPADGSAPPKLRLRHETALPLSSSPDGELLLCSLRPQEDNRDLALLPLREDSPLRPVTQTPFREYGGRISPDGKWVAYVAHEGTRSEIFVQSLHSPGTRWQVSGGLSEAATITAPRWSDDGKELFYRRGIKVYSARIREEGGRLRISEPEYLLDLEGRHWEVFGDGFLTMHTSFFPGTEVANVVLNWRTELEERFRSR